MAVDTVAKRVAVVGAFTVQLPLPDGTVGAADRATLNYEYAPAGAVAADTLLVRRSVVIGGGTAGFGRSAFVLRV